jgi:hypothetical protein
MASESDLQQEPSSLIERLINSRNRDLSMLLPVILGFTNTTDEDSTATRGARDRIILINPMTQGMVVIEGSSAGLDSLLRDLMSKGGQPPATKASIESMPSVVIGECEDGECVICLDEWLEGEVVKEMPCKHKFHGNCVEKWLKLHGSCPVCRYKMPADDPVKKFGEDRESSTGNNNTRREIWLSFSVNSDRRTGNSTNNTESASSDSSPNPRSDEQTED